MPRLLTRKVNVIRVDQTSALADELASIHAQKKEVTALWEDARSRAIATGLPTFSSEHTLIQCVLVEASVWDTEKIESLMKRLKLSPSRYKKTSSMVKVLVKAIA